MFDHIYPVQNLPYQSTHFVGREREIHAYSLILDNSDCRLLTLVGPGGIGKTRLAIQLALHQHEKFQNGVFFVPLRHLSSVKDVPSTIAEVLRIPMPSKEDLLQAILSYLHDKHLLLVMDNLEHLIVTTNVISNMLAVAPQLKILTTSRETLGLREEWVRPIVGLDYPDYMMIDNDNIDSYDAVQLFANRARQMQGHFSLADERLAVLRICSLVGGMPLALELAASWTRLLSCNDIVNEIEKDLEFLTTTQQNVPEHHRSMQLVFNQTWQQLTAVEQDIFCKLSVFQGGFNREAAEQVAGASLTTLAALVDKALVWLDSDRYEVHELLRQYATGKLTTNELQDMERLHYQFFADWIERRKSILEGEQQLAAFTEIEADWHNVTIAWYRAVQAGAEQIVNRMVEVVYRFCTMGSRFQEAERLFEHACQRFSELADTEATTWFCLQTRLKSVQLSRRQTHPQMYKANIEEILALAKRHNESAVAFCYWLLGEVARESGTFADSLPYMEISQQHFETLGDRYYAARALRDRIFCLAELGPARWKEAQSANQQLYILTQETGDIVSFAHSLFYKAEFSRDSGNLGEANHLLKEAEAIWRSLEDWRYVEVALSARSHIAFTTGDLIGAEVMAREVLKLNRHYDSLIVTRAYALLTLGLLAGLNEDYKQARQLCEEAERLSRPSIGGWRIDPFLGMSMAAIGLSDYEQAKRDLYPLLNQLVFETTNKVNQIACLPLAAAVLAADHEPEQAVELLGLAFSFSTSVTGWMTKWHLLTRLQADLENKLGPEHYKMLWEQGQSHNIQTTIKTLHATFHPENVMESIDNLTELVEPLSNRENEVLRLLAIGMTNPEIAMQLIIAVGTVKAHTSNIYSKLGTRNRVEAIKRATDLGLIDRPNE